MKGVRILVGVAVAVAAGATGIWYVQYKRSHDPGAALRSLARRAAIAEGPAHRVIEFQLALGEKLYDVVPDDALELEGGVEVELAPNPKQRTSGPGFHVTHHSSVSVSTPPLLMEAAVEGARVKLQLWEPREPGSDLESGLEAAIVNTGDVRGMTTVRRVIAGEPRVGKRYDLVSKQQVEVFVVPFGTTKLGVQLIQTDPNPDLARLEELLSSVAAGEAEPEPLFTARVGDKTVPLYLDRAAELPFTPPVTVVLRRRPLVRRVVVGSGGMLEFEHAPNLAVVRTLDTKLLSVVIRSDQIAVELTDMPVRMTPEELLLDRYRSNPTASEVGLVTHPYAGGKLNGYRVQLIQPPMEIELYGFERDGHTITATVTYLTAEKARALEIALPVIASLK